MIAAAIQMTSGSDKNENYKKVVRFTEEAASKKAELLVLPEHWNWLGPSAEKQKTAESLDGPSLKVISDLAKKYRCHFVAGSIGEKNEDKPPYNTAVIVHADGSLGKAYRKIHLFDTEVAGGHKESATVSAGNEVVVERIKSPSPLEPVLSEVEGGEGCLSAGSVAEGEGFNIGLSICYDIRFPELYRKMGKAGATLFAFPSNFTAITGVAHWEILVRARAIENQCFIVAADQTGMTGAGWEAHGHSMIVDPWGEILASLGKGEGVITAELDFSKLDTVRKQMPSIC